jgi:hypothetical protein
MYHEDIGDLHAKRTPTFENVLCTDACLDGLGWCLGRRSGETRWSPARPHRCQGRRVPFPQHIYLLEVEAALEGLEWWVHRVRDPNDEIARVTLVVDNAAAAYTLRYGFSNNLIADGLMQRKRTIENMRYVVKGWNRASEKYEDWLALKRGPAAQRAPACGNSDAGRLRQRRIPR